MLVKLILSAQLFFSLSIFSQVELDNKKICLEKSERSEDSELYTKYVFSNGKTIHVLGHAHFTPGEHFAIFEYYLKILYKKLANDKEILDLRKSYERKYQEHKKNEKIINNLISLEDIQTIAKEWSEENVRSFIQNDLPALKKNHESILIEKHRLLYEDIFLLLYGPNMFSLLTQKLPESKNIQYMGVDSQQLGDLSDNQFHSMVENFELMKKSITDKEEKPLTQLESCITKSMESNSPITPETLTHLQPLFSKGQAGILKRVINSRNLTIKADKDRDVFMARQLLELPGNVFYPVGSAHFEGINDYFEKMRCTQVNK